MNANLPNTHLHKDQMMDLLLDPAAVSPATREHVAGCAACTREWKALEATMLALDSWEAPEPTQYFDTRLQARLREERDSPPASLWERMRARFVYGSNVHFRPVAAAALALLLMVGGGTAAWVGYDQHGAAVPESATVRDLQLLDGNAQVYQQLSSLDADLDNTDNSGDPATN